MFECPLGSTFFQEKFELPANAMGAIKFMTVHKMRKEFDIYL